MGAVCVYVCVCVGGLGGSPRIESTQRELSHGAEKSKWVPEIVFELSYRDMPERLKFSIRELIDSLFGLRPSLG